MSQPTDSSQPQDQDKGVIYKEVYDLFKAMTKNLDMMVERELQGRQSTLKSSFIPRPMSMNPSMTATPSDAPSLAQPSTLLVPLTLAIPSTPTPFAPEMSKYAVLQGAVVMCFSSTTSTCPYGEHMFVSLFALKILQTNENKSKEYDEGLEELNDVDANACAAAKTSMESKENITYLCIDTKLSTIFGHWNKSRTACHQEGENNEIMHMFAASGAYIRMLP
jgi:hypothetical protein